MHVDAFQSVDQLISLLAALDKVRVPGASEIVPTMEVSTLLIPRWKNYLTTRSDFFDRYPEMVSHGSVHVANLCNLCLGFISPLVENAKKASKSDEKINPIPINSAELFFLIAGIFLHDVGMSDPDESAESFDDIRNNHSQISARLIRKSYEHTSSADNKNIQPDELIPNPFVWGEIGIEIINNVVIHHQSSAPLTEFEFHKRYASGKYLSVEKSLEKKLQETAQASEPEDNEGVFSAPVMKFHGHDVDVLYIAAILRLIDACDYQYSRLGSILFTKTAVNQIEREKNNLREEYESIRPLIEKIESKGITPEFRKETELIIQEGKRVKQRLEYLSIQLPSHYAKHAAIEKVWFHYSASMKIQVVYKPVEINAIKMFLSKIADSVPNIRDHEEGLAEELEKEIRDNQLNKVFRKRGISVSSKVTKYHKIKDKQDLLELKALRESVARIPLNSGSASYVDTDVKQIVSMVQSCHISNKHHKLFAFIAPAGSGKTRFSRHLAKQFSIFSKDDLDEEGRSKFNSGVCYINCDGLRKADDSKVIDHLYKTFVFFLASRGDFFFYNILRNQLYIDIDHWRGLVERLNSGSYVLIFNEFNQLSRKNKSSIVYNYLDIFFKILVNYKESSRKSIVIMFSQMIPAMLDIESFLDDSKSYRLMALPKIKQETVCKTIKRKFKQTSVNAAELEHFLNEKISQFNDLPIIYNYLEDELLFAGDFDKSASKFLEKRLKNKIRGFIRAEIIKKYNLTENRRLYNDIENYPVSSMAFNNLQVHDMEKNSNALKYLIRRGMLYYYRYNDESNPKEIITRAPQGYLKLTGILKKHLLPELGVKLNEHDEKWWSNGKDISWINFLCLNDMSLIMDYIGSNQLIDICKCITENHHIDFSHREALRDGYLKTSLDVFSTRRDYKLPPIYFPEHPGKYIYAAMILDVLYGSYNAEYTTKIGTLSSDSIVGTSIPPRIFAEAVSVIKELPVIVTIIQNRSGQSSEILPDINSDVLWLVFLIWESSRSVKGLQPIGDREERLHILAEFIESNYKPSPL